MRPTLLDDLGERGLAAHYFRNQLAAMDRVTRNADQLGLTPSSREGLRAV